MKQFIKNCFLVLLIAASIAQNSCGPNGPEEAKQAAFHLSAEGPFFDGPNTLQAEISLNAEEAGKYAQVKLNTIEIMVPDTLFTALALKSVTVQFAHSDLAMTSVGVANPAKTENGKLLVELSKEAEVTDFFNKKAFTVVCDFDLGNEYQEVELGLDAQLNYSAIIKN